MKANSHNIEKGKLIKKIINHLEYFRNHVCKMTEIIISLILVRVKG